MNNINLIEEMIDITLQHRNVEETSLLSKIPLAGKVVRLGSLCILKWLRTQSIALKMKPLKLESTSDVGKSCVLLIEQSEDLRRIFQIKNGYLLFSDVIHVEEAKNLMTIARDKYKPPILTEK